MSKKLEFRISAALKNIIGRDLITDDFIAVFELVKNSYDAYASSVEIIFEGEKIVIKDNGKGMSYSDLKEKWLFVAYSAKKEGVEDKNLDRLEDYRSKVSPKRYYAGAKGVGRFSCDRLGSELKLITKRPDSEEINQLKVDWGRFDQDSEDEFVNIKVDHTTLNESPYDNFENGTILEITSLNSNWPRSKILKLKHSLEKLINPFQVLDEDSQNESVFSIDIIAEHEKEKDKETKKERKKVNGPVKNFIFEKLNVKTTQIITEVFEDYIITTLKDRGEEIYKIKEENDILITDRNKIPEKLTGIKYHLFYLNRAAKYNFTSEMGIQPVRFGSVFLYRNGFRVYPYGEPDRDMFNIDVRKAQKHYSRLGTRDLLGRIEITDDKDEFKETSSRDGGLIQNSAYYEMRKLFLEKCLERLENYVVGIQWSLKDKGEELDLIKSLEGKNKIIRLVSELADSDNIELISYNKNFLDIISDKIDEEAPDDIFQNLKKLAEVTGDEDYASKIEEAHNKYQEELEIRRHIERELSDTKKENLFLKSLRSSDFDEIVSFMHQVSISANTVDNYLKGIYKRINSNVEIPPEEIKDIIETVTLENKKIMSVAKFATKANFKLYTEESEIDLVNYIEEYVFNVVKSVQSNDFKIKLRISNEFEFKIKTRPIEINILIDNLISNSKKASADNVEIHLIQIDEDHLEIRFKDDGDGIEETISEKVFEFGFTTTSGSGLGLFHVKKIVTDLGGYIQINKGYKKGTELIISLEK